MTRRVDRDALPLRLHPNISLTVRVEDGPSSGRDTEMVITIIVEDVNDNPPECNPSAFRYGVSSLPCCPRPVCRPGHMPRPTAGGSSAHLPSACLLYWAVVHHHTWGRFWVASSIVAYLDLGFHFKNKSMFWPVIYEEFKRRNLSCFDRKCVCFKQERSK